MSTFYGKILKSTTIMGGVAGVNMLISMVRTKFTALLIGATGIGLQGNFIAIQGLISAIAGFGIQSSAIREVAAAVAEKDSQSIGRVILSLRRISILTGLLGMTILGLSSPIIGRITFGSSEYTYDIAALGLVVFFGNLQGGQTAILQGMLYIRELAIIQLSTALLGLIVAISCYALFSLRGIVPALVLTSAIQLAISWFYANKIMVPQVTMSWWQSLVEATNMIKVGFFWMWSSLLAGTSIYFINANITREVNIESVGLFGSALALSSIFISYILNAMNVDYYPRLSSLSRNNKGMTELINQQTEIGLLIAIPGMLLVIIMAPWLLQFFYSTEFMAASEILQWLALALITKLISHPLTYMLLATKKLKWYFFTETIFNLFLMLSVFLGLTNYELKGAAVSYAIALALYSVLMYLLSRRLIIFEYSVKCYRLIALSICVAISVFSVMQIPSGWISVLISCLLTIFFSIISIRGIYNRLGGSSKTIKLLAYLPGVTKYLRWKKLSWV